MFGNLTRRVIDPTLEEITVGIEATTITVNSHLTVTFLHTGGPDSQFVDQMPHPESNAQPTVVGCIVMSESTKEAASVSGRFLGGLQSSRPFIKHSFSVLGNAQACVPRIRLCQPILNHDDGAVLILTSEYLRMDIERVRLTQ